MKFTRPNLSTTRLAAVVFCTIIVLLARLSLRFLVFASMTTVLLVLSATYSSAQIPNGTVMVSVGSETFRNGIRGRHRR
jgi:hypothetical protein